MTAPAFVLRSYGGGAEPAQLTNAIGASDSSFGIDTTTGWTENDGNPLGTVGPFVVVIDRFSDTVEKILCSAIDLTTGLITVYDVGGFFGRGYDDSNAQGHSPGTTTSGVQTTWSSVEAAEANTLVNLLLGQSPTAGQIVQWNGTEPVYASNISGVTGIPAGRLYATSGPGCSTGVWSDIVLGGTSYTSGGMTVGSSTLIAPATGYYQINAQVVFESSSGIVAAGIAVNGTQVSAGTFVPAISTGAGAVDSDLLPVTAGQTIGLLGYQTSGGTIGPVTNGALVTYISAVLAAA